MAYFDHHHLTWNKDWFKDFGNLLAITFNDQIDIFDRFSDTEFKGHFFFVVLVDAKLMIVGSYEKELDPVAPETQNEIETNGNIVFAGFQSDVRPYILAADALILPSYREGMPNVVMQAGALNRPCIVTNINGSNEIIIEGKNGNIGSARGKRRKS